MFKALSLLSSRMGLFNMILSAQKNLNSPNSPLLLIFWGSRGSGKTTFLNTVKEKLSANSDIEILGFWNADDFTTSALSNSNGGRKWNSK